MAGHGMSLRQAAEQALEALRYTTDHLPAKTGVERHVDEAITALQVALSQPEWVGLTDQDIDLYALDIGVTANKAPPWLVKYARDIEQALKDKNI